MVFNHWSIDTVSAGEREPNLLRLPDRAAVHLQLGHLPNLHVRHGIHRALVGSALPIPGTNSAELFILQKA